MFPQIPSTKLPKTLNTYFIKKSKAMADSIFRQTIEFFHEVGLYDVVLPFLLVFTVVFAMLEKTKVFGVEKIGDRDYTRKNINAMVAFVVGFLVVASSQIVETITTVSSNVIVLLMISVLFMLLIGSFMKEGQMQSLEGGWKIFFMFVMLIGIIIIFLDAITDSNGDSFLQIFWEVLSGGRNSTAIGSTILIILVIMFMMYILKDTKPKVLKES